MGDTYTGYLYNTSAGPDATWHTSDDRCAVYYDDLYDGQGLKTREVYRTCAADQLPHTADDGYGQYYEYEYDADKQVSRINLKNSPGPNGTWIDSDDLYSTSSIFPGLVRYQRNSAGLITETLTSWGAGSDGMFGTIDDVGRRDTTTYNAMKLPEEATSYSIGADNMWGTADDVITTYTKTTYDVNGNRTDAKTYGAGADGIFKTPDDRVLVDFDFDFTR
jgi:hypothetical protein